MYEATILDKTGKKFSPLLPPFQWWKKWCTLPLPPDLMGWNNHPKVGHNILSACSYTVFHQLLKMLGDRKAQWRYSSPVKEGTLFFYIHNSPVYSFITIGFDQAFKPKPGQSWFCYDSNIDFLNLNYYVIYKIFLERAEILVWYWPSLEIATCGFFCCDRRLRAAAGLLVSRVESKDSIRETKLKKLYQGVGKAVFRFLNGQCHFHDT